MTTTRDRAAIYAVALAVFAGIGVILTWDSRGNPATGWMRMFDPADFAAPGTLAPFIAGLQAPISPWLAALEILSQRWLGTAAPVTVGLYRASLIGGYLVAMLLTWPSLPRLALSFVLSVLFLWATVLIHPASPIVYDVVLPFLLVAYFALLRIGSPAVLAVAGVALALAELTRPYVLILLPLLLAGAWCGVRRMRILALLAPVLLISGAWHLHQWANHGQLTWSNHAGFNMIRAWRMVAYPELLPEPGAVRLAPDRLPNLNTPEHAENSRRLVRAVLDYIRANPGDGALHMLERVAVFVGAGHQIEDHAPDHALLPVYDVVVKYANIAMLAAALAIVLVLLRLLVVSPLDAMAALGRGDNQMLLLMAGAMVLIAITESGEEARFQISILPLMAALPLPFLPDRRGADRFQRIGSWPASRKRRAIAALAALVVVVEVLTWGSTRRPAGAASGGPIAVPERPGADPYVERGRLHVAQFNVRGGAWRDREREIAANGACLRDLDLAGLAEVRGPRFFGLAEGQLPALAAASGLVPLYAPAEWRWWGEHFGNALLTALPVERWTRTALPHRSGVSYRSMLAAAIPVDGRRLNVLVAQIDNHDHVIQIEAIDAAFRASAVPALLLADFGTSDPRKEPLKRLVGDPAFLALTNQPPFPEATVQGGWILAKGFRRVDVSFCKGGVSMQPRLAATLEFLP